MTTEETRSPSQIIGAIWQWLEKISLYIQMALLFPAAVVFTLWSFPPTRAFFIKKHWFDENTAFEVVGLASVLTLLFLGRLSRGVSLIAHRLERLAPARHEIIPGGISNLYPRVKKAIKAARTPRERTLEAPALTLYSFRPPLQSWINEGTLDHWHIVMYCLCPTFLRSSEWASKEWSSQAATHIESVRRYQQERHDELSRRSIVLELRVYETFPAVTGVRLGNGDIFFALMHWDEGSGHLDNPHSAYEYFPSANRSDRAEHYQNYFDNWIKHLEKSGCSHAAPW
jgi:hypothetical protein